MIFQFLFINVSDTSKIYKRCSLKSQCLLPVDPEVEMEFTDSNKPYLGKR